MSNIKNKIINIQDWIWPADDNGCWNYMVTNHDVPQEISKYVKNKGIVVQAGGNAGFYIKQYSEIFEHVYVFEPDPYNFFSLVQNCDKENVIKFQACVGNKRGCVSLGAQFNNDLGSLHVNGVGMMPVLLIDDLGLPGCDLIQLDTEGYEYFGLLGAQKTIDKYKPIICIEWYQEWAARYSITLEKMEKLLSDWGYSYIAEYRGDRIYSV